MKIHILAFIFFFFIHAGEALSEELPLYLTYMGADQPASMVLPDGQLQIDLSYSLMNDAVDILGLKQREEQKLAISGGKIGDYTGLNLGLHYGLTHNLTCSGGYKYLTLGYQDTDLNIKTLDISTRWTPNGYLALDLGLKAHQADDLIMADLAYMNYYVHKFKSNLDIEVDNQYVWYVLTYPDMIIRYGIPRKADPQISVEDMQDYTWYLRLTLGYPEKIFYPNIFLEAGYTRIDTRLDTNLTDMIPQSYKSYLPDFPIDLGRTERYLSAGFSFFLQTPFDTITHLEYEYKRIYRDKGLDYIPDNHIARGEIAYLLTQNVILHLGATLLYRQFNGEIPFLYNKYTQTTFDHPYGWMEFGVRYLF